MVSTKFIEGSGGKLAGRWVLLAARSYGDLLDGPKLARLRFGPVKAGIPTR